MRSSQLLPPISYLLRPSFGVAEQVEEVSRPCTNAALTNPINQSNNSAKKKSSNQHESIIDDLQRTILKRKGQSKIQTDFLVTRAFFFFASQKSQIFVQISVFLNVKILVVQVENLLVISHFFAGFWVSRRKMISDLNI